MVRILPSQLAVAGMTTTNCISQPSINCVFPRCRADASVDRQRGARERKSADQQNAGAGFERHYMNREAVCDKSYNGANCHA